MNLLSWYRRIRSPGPASDAEAVRLRAEAGDAEAQFRLGVRCVAGREAAPDFIEAVRWFREAAEQDHRLAQFHLGRMLAQGQGLPRDEAASLVWFRRAAEGGEGSAQHALGTACHRRSLGEASRDSSESRIEAYKWLRLAAVQGNNGSEAAQERVTLGMTRAEVSEGNHRVTAFVACAASNRRQR
jgi:hypothetical protein